MEIAKASALNRSLKFNVRRCQHELIPPSQPTPREFKRLSDLDNEESLQLLMPGVLFFPPNPKIQPAKDPVKVLRQALAEVLVYYYPLAGRIRKCTHSTPRLVVDCNEEGALFIEADADITLAQLGDTLHPPYSYLDDIMYDVPGMGGVINSPVFHIQVTRLKCGGFILGTRYNATIMDGTGLAQLTLALSEIAQGASKPSILPVWDRDRLFARIPPRVTCTHPEFEEATQPILIQNKAYRIFYFTNKEIAALKTLVPPHLKKSSSFELMTGFLWRCRTLALQLDPKEDVRMIFALNARDRYEPPLPKGFYGNAFAFAASITTAAELCKNPLEYAVELVVNAKNNVTEEYMRSFIDGLRMRGWPRIPMLMSSFFTSDLRKMGYLNADFGWGEPHAAGPGIAWYEPYPQEETNYVLCKVGATGQLVTVVPMCLPEAAMKIFEQEVYSTLKICSMDPFTKVNGVSPIPNNVIRSYM